MVKCTNGIQMIEVTNGAYESIFKKQGYRPVVENRQVEQVEDEVKKTEDELFIEVMSAKPIAQWKKDDIKRFADINGIDLVGTKNAEEARDLIKEYLASIE